MLSVIPNEKKGKKKQNTAEERLMPDCCYYSIRWILICYFGPLHSLAFYKAHTFGIGFLGFT